MRIKKWYDENYELQGEHYIIEAYVKQDGFEAYNQEMMRYIEDKEKLEKQKPLIFKIFERLFGCTLIAKELKNYELNDFLTGVDEVFLKAVGEVEIENKEDFKKWNERFLKRFRERFNFIV